VATKRCSRQPVSGLRLQRNRTGFEGTRGATGDDHRPQNGTVNNTPADARASRGRSGARRSAVRFGTWIHVFFFGGPSIHAQVETSGRCRRPTTSCRLATLRRKPAPLTSTADRTGDQNYDRSKHLAGFAPASVLDAFGSSGDPAHGDHHRPPAPHMRCCATTTSVQLQ